MGRNRPAYKKSSNGAYSGTREPSKDDDVPLLALKPCDTSGTSAPPVGWDQPEELKHPDAETANTTDYTYDVYGTRVLNRVPIYSGSTATEGVLRLKSDLETYASVCPEKNPHSAIKKLRMLRAWTTGNARKQVDTAASSTLFLGEDEEEENENNTKTCDKWIQDGDSATKDRAFATIMARLIISIAGIHPFDREREWILADLPELTEHATREDVMAYIRRVETLADYLLALREAQEDGYPLDAQARQDATLTTRQKREILLRKLYTPVQKKMKAKNDIWQLEDTEFQDRIDQSMIDVKIEQQKAKALLAQLRSDRQKEQQQQQQQQPNQQLPKNLFCRKCKDAGRQRAAYTSHAPEDCTYNKRREEKRSLNQIDKHRRRKRKKRHDYDSSNDDSSDDSDY